MASLRQSAIEVVSADMRIDRAPESSKSVAPVDFWGRAVPFDETADEELSRLLLPINWLCSLLERMDRAPADAELHRDACEELMDRLVAGCHSPDLRDSLIDAGVWVAARRYGSAATTLRAVAA